MFSRNVLRNWLSIVAVLYAAFVLVSNLWLGEATPVTMLCAYAPVGLALVPLLVSGCVLLILKRMREALLHFGLLALLLLVASGISYGSVSSLPGDLSIATYNIHLPKTQPEQDAIVKELMAADADVICLQETTLDWNPQLPGYHQHRIGQMLIASRYPITARRGVRVPFSTASRPLLIATIDVRGKAVTIANVHLRQLDFAGIGKLLGDLPKSGPEKVVEAEFIKGEMLALNTPFALCGDFNATPTSKVSRIFRSVAEDTYASCSFGFGFTTVLRRIDYIMAGGTLKPVAARVIPSGNSDHNLLRSVVAFR